ncbi:MAG: Trk system potassium transporter TrkH [Arsenophonus endosymbiont of Ceratovacuna japonica]
MHFRVISKIIGLLVILFSVMMIIPVIISLIYLDGTEYAFIKTFIISLIIGLLFWIPNRNNKHDLKSKEGFLIVALFWIVLGSIGALPFIFSHQLHLSVTDACFESFSGLTTTGATTLIRLDYFPKAILFYRQMLQWLGGMGIIVLAVAILPLLGIGGIQLYRAEIPGPLKDNKMRPRISETAKILWLIYILLTIVCAITLWFAGMDIFDAISHSFSTVSIGGFSTHDKSIGYFNNSTINIIIAIFLLISSCNFNLHFYFLSGHNLIIYWYDPEFKVFIIFQLVLIFICTLILWCYSVYDSLLQILNQVFFQVISMTTTAGFSADGLSKWPIFLPILLLFSSFVGGCTGSTGGGLKVIRILLLYLQGLRELKRLVHPNAIYTIKLNSRVLSGRIIESVWGFFSAYALVFIISLLLLISTGVDEFSAFISIASSLNNLGLGLGSVTENFSTLTTFGKWILIVTMLFGRLEVFTLLVLFTPAFWRE